MRPEIKISVYKKEQDKHEETNFYLYHVSLKKKKVIPCCPSLYLLCVCPSVYLLIPFYGNWFTLYWWTIMVT